MLIVGTDVKYASSSNTANAALTPDLLDAGSIGIYTLVNGVYKLVVKNGSPSTGQVSSTAVKSGFLKIVQGLGNGDFYVSETHDVAGIQSITGAAYRAGSGQTIYFGYNPSTGTGDVNFTPNSGITNTFGSYTDLNQSEAFIKLREQYRGNNSYGADLMFNHVVVASDTALSILTDLNSQVNAYQQDGILGAVFTSTLTGNYLTAPVQSASSTATTGGTLAADTYYYVIVALSATGWSLKSNEISQVTTGSTSTVTLNWVAVTGAASYRIYRGTTTGGQSVYYTVNSGSTITYTDTNATSTAGVPPTSTALGLAINPIDIYQKYAGAAGDRFSQASISSVDPVIPSGDPYQLAGKKGNYVKNELESNIYRGDMYTMSTIEKKLPKTIDLTKTYDTYNIKSINSTDDKTGQTAKTYNAINTLVALVVPSSHTVGTNQEADIQAIFVDIFSATATIF